MPIIYLSPSTQENNFYVTGGTEEQWMNRLADAMEPYLISSGIRYVRNTPEMTASSSIRASNAGNYDLHVALHSNAAPDGQYGSARGIIVFYFPGSSNGQRAALIMAENLKVIYPLPNLVRAEPTVMIGEVRRVRAPSVFLEIGYHDNPDDAAWVTQNLESIARNLVLSLTEYFGLPFLEPRPTQPGIVDISWGTLNIRDRPNRMAPILASVVDGTALTVINEWQGWYLVQINNILGWASKNFVTLL